MSAIYLDNAATTFPKPPCVITAVTACLEKYAVSPYRGSSSLVLQANRALEECRRALADEFGVQSSRVVLVPSATYAINAVLRGYPFPRGSAVYSSPWEHNASARTLQDLADRGEIRWKLLPLGATGTLDLTEASRQFAVDPPELVVVTHASNVTGALLPIGDLTELVHRHRGRVLLDAAQTFGIGDMVGCESCDFVAFSSHKGLYGIQGSGALIIRADDVGLTPLLYGGTGTRSEDLTMPPTYPDRFEAGTHCLPAIVSMGSGLQWVQSTGKAKIRAHIDTLCEQLLEGLQGIRGVYVHGRSAYSQNSGIVSFTMDYWSPQQVSAFLDSVGIVVRAGLHCAPLAHRVLGTYPYGTVRVSPGFFNTAEDIEALVTAIRELHERL